MPETSPVDIISDAPESERIEFGFEAYARTIAGLTYQPPVRLTWTHRHRNVRAENTAAFFCGTFGGRAETRAVPTRSAQVSRPRRGPDRRPLSQGKCPPKLLATHLRPSRGATSRDCTIAQDNSE